MRFSLSIKVFLLFSLISLVLLLFGTAVYLGLEEEERLLQAKARADELEHALMKLEKYPLAGRGRASVDQLLTMFSRDIATIRAAVARAIEEEQRHFPQQGSMLESLLPKLGYYEKAFFELMERVERDAELPKVNVPLLQKMRKESETLPLPLQVKILNKTNELRNMQAQIYHDRDASLIATMKSVVQEIAADSTNSVIGENARRFVRNVEDNYLNYLGIDDRRQFLDDTHQSFAEIAHTIVGRFYSKIDDLHDWYRLQIIIFGLLAISLTIVFWFVSVRHLKRFLFLQGQSMEAVQEGRYDYELPLDIPADELGDEIRFVKEMANSIQKNLSELRTSEERSRTLIENLDVVITMISKDFEIVTVNRAIKNFFDKPLEEFVGKKCYVEFEKRDSVCPHCPGRTALETRLPAEAFTQVLCDNGTKRHFHIRTFPLMDESGAASGFIELVEDITAKLKEEDEKRSLENQMQQVQKLESLGVLAGGIAHDFNNLLMVVLGNADLALTELSPVSPARRNIQEIEKASRRAADLCKQMLAYSGRGNFILEKINISQLVEEMAHMLEVSISKNGILKYNFAPTLPPVIADPTQVRQIVMNLIINASEAIGSRSGVISITTGAMQCDSSYLKSTYVAGNPPEGLYVYLEVADTGCGMDETTKNKLFDPFFTTKFTGRGLGMAAVLGIVRGHKGSIKIYSEVNKGTTIKILLPAADGDTVAVSSASQVGPEEWRGAGTVLLVDDDETVRAVSSQMLERLGFSVITAADGVEAVEIYKNRVKEIVCVILDLTMPRMGGEETFRELRRVDPNVTVILSSGYNEQEISQRFAGKGLSGFIQKPYSMAPLRTVLHNVLSGEAEGEVIER